MHTIAHGVDIVEVARIRAMLKAHPRRFVARVFTEHESARSAGRRRAEHLAARFAAKEAVMKALGTGLTGGIAWTEIEVVTLPSGAPSLRLSGRAAEIARGLGIRAWLVSLSHVESLAMASVIGIGNPAKTTRAA
ncbi:MAG: holo-ACP synthase [Phycisphaerae bacterium]|nr:holo-ACP synthase [Phycisphaerae bacterium]